MHEREPKDEANLFDLNWICWPKIARKSIGPYTQWNRPLILNQILSSLLSIIHTLPYNTEFYLPKRPRWCGGRAIGSFTHKARVRVLPNAGVTGLAPFSWLAPDDLRLKRLCNCPATFFFVRFQSALTFELSLLTENCFEITKDVFKL